MAKEVVLMELESNPNIGLFIFANDKFALAGRNLGKKQKEEVEKVLKVPVYTISILNTDLVGVFLAGNNDFLFIPEDLEDYERNELEKITKKHDMQLIEIKDKQNTLGNNIAVGKDSILFNFHYPKRLVEKTAKQTGCNCLRYKDPEYDNIGALCKFANGKFFVSQELEEEQLKDILPVIGGVGTINKGSPYVASGLVGNINGLIIGGQSSTIEIQAAVEALEYL